MSVLYPHVGDFVLVRLPIIEATRTANGAVTVATAGGIRVLLTDADGYTVEPKLKVGERVYDPDGNKGEVLRQRGAFAIILWTNGSVNADVPVVDLERAEMKGDREGEANALQFGES
jgi:hypothetical protein